MDMKLYLEVQVLFRSKWDPAILEVLADRPCRFLALARRVRVLVDGGMEQSAVNRALGRLQNAGYVHAAQASDGTRVISVYELTDAGQDALAAYRAILTAFEKARPPTPPRSDTAPSTDQTSITDQPSITDQTRVTDQRAGASVRRPSSAQPENPSRRR